MTIIKELTLHAYFYSSASWRVRTVLTLKNIPFKYEAVHLLNGDQHESDFSEKNPMHQVPVLQVTLRDGSTHYITQSLAIINYLEESYPDHSVFPRDPILRAKCRAIADTISAGIQPLQNLETLTKYTEPLGQPPLDPNDRKKVAQFWINRKLDALEKLVKPLAGQYCIGDRITLADICLVPQMLNARRFEVDTSNYPTIKEIDERLQELPIFKETHPLKCPDAPKQS